MSALTERQLDALRVLHEKDRLEGFTPSAFATHFWPGKMFARSNGPWGLGPDASGRHGGRMLTRLASMGLVTLTHHDCYYTARISAAGRDALRRAES